MSTKRAVHFHKPRAHHTQPKHKQVAAQTHTAPVKSDADEKVDLPTPPTAKSGAEAFSIEIPATAQAVMRKDYFTDNYVIIAPKRHLRPLDYAGSTHRLVETSSSPRLETQQEIDAVRDRNGHWKTKVVPNKFPALSLDNPQAFGAQEIVIDTPLVNTPMGRLDREQLTAILQTYRKRTLALLKLRGIKYVTVFKNDGIRAGASLAHAHSQIFATPLIPTKVARISTAVEAYFQKHNQDPYEAVLSFEREQKVRVVSENADFMAFCPFASRWPLDVWIIPIKHHTSITDFSDQQLRNLAGTLQPLIAKLTRFEIDYNFYLENGVSPNHRFALKLQARSLNWWAGFEIATEIAINPIPPEIAADWYRSPKNQT